MPYVRRVNGVIIGATKWPNVLNSERVDDGDQDYLDFITAQNAPRQLPRSPFVIPKDPNPNKPVTHEELGLILDALYAINAARES